MVFVHCAQIGKASLCEILYQGPADKTAGTGDDDQVVFLKHVAAVGLAVIFLILALLGFYAEL